jgi:hypothetical protein
MGLPDRTRIKLAAEGLTNPEDFIDFPDKEDLDALILKCLKPAKIAGGAAANARPREVLQYEIPARSEVRLQCARLIVKYYSTVGREIEADDLFWPVLRNFMEHWKAMKEKKSAPVGIPPKLNKDMAVHRWIERFAQDLEEVIGVRNAPLTYLTRPSIATPADVATAVRAVDQPYAEIYTSIEEEMKYCLSHTHNLMKADNATLFHRIDKAVTGHDVYATIAPYRRYQDGRGAFLAILSQHAGRHVYDKIVKDAMHVLTVRKWTGNPSITLAQHIASHRKAFIQLADAKEHTPTETPNPRQRVSYLLNSMADTVDPKVLAAMAAVELDETHMRINFEATATFLLPQCPVAAKQGKKNSLGAKISGTAGKVLTGSKGKTGVTLCWHEPKLFRQLPKDQKEELAEWNKNNRENKRKGTPGKPGDNTRRVRARVATDQIAAMTASHAADVAVLQARIEMLGVAPAPPAPAGTLSPAVGAVVGFTPTPGHYAPTSSPALLLPGLMETARVASVKLQSILKKNKSTKPKSAAP